MSDADFNTAIHFIIWQLEAGDTVLIDDDGVTKYGICSKWHPGVDVRHLTYEQAVEIYQEYRKESHFDDYPLNVGIMFLDCYINMQIHTADKLRTAFHNYQNYAVFNDTFTLARMFYYLQLANDNPRQRENLRGWMNRCKLLYNFVETL